MLFPFPFPFPVPLFEPGFPSSSDAPPPQRDVLAVFGSGVSEHSIELPSVLVTVTWVDVAVFVPVDEDDAPPFASVVEAEPAVLVTAAVWLPDDVAVAVVSPPALLVAVAVSKLARLAALLAELILSANRCGADDTIVHCVKKRTRAS